MGMRLILTALTALLIVPGLLAGACGDNEVRAPQTDSDTDEDTDVDSDSDTDSDSDSDSDTDTDADSDSDSDTGYKSEDNWDCLICDKPGDWKAVDELAPPARDRKEVGKNLLF